MTLTYMVSCTPVSLTMIAFVPLCYNTVISDGEIYVVVIITGNADIFGNGDVCTFVLILFTLWCISQDLLSITVEGAFIIYETF